MAYRCDKCGEAQQAGTKAHKVVVKTRGVDYTNYDFNGKVKHSAGHETVKELTVCRSCRERVAV